MKTAMKAKDKEGLAALRAIKESADIYTKENRTDLAEVELGQAKVIEEFLPKQLSDEELEAEVKKIIAEVGATTKKDMGKVMGQASKVLAGRADGKRISGIVGRMLN